MARPSRGKRVLSGIELTGIGLAVGTLYALVLNGHDSGGFWRQWMTGAPVGLEAVLTEDEIRKSAELDQALTRIGYRLDRVAQVGTVPALFVPRVPADLGEMAEIDAKKRVFLRVMLPLILAANEDIALDRERLERIVANRTSNRGLDDEDAAFVAKLAERYGVEGHNPARLLIHVDIVPPSLALAQAAEESGWGTSRFTREGNNLFGQVTSAGAGLVPEGAQDGRRMASFDTLYDAVRAYVHNLNTHRAYQVLRQARAQTRARGVAMDGHALAGALATYSERGDDYVDTIRSIIRRNSLARFDHARLRRDLGDMWVSAGS